MKKSILGAAVALLAYSCLPAHAAGWPEQRSIAVHVGDLDLAKTDGMRALFGRLHIAARQACSSVDSGSSLIYISVYRACVHDALRTAVAKLDNPTFTSYVAQRQSTARSRIASN